MYYKPMEAKFLYFCDTDNKLSSIIYNISLYLTAEIQTAHADVV